MVHMVRTVLPNYNVKNDKSLSTSRLAYVSIDNKYIYVPL